MPSRMPRWTPAKRRGGQVGVGVGAADAVLDMPTGGRAARHAQAHGAVVDAPGLRQRRVAVGLEAPVGVGVGTEQQERVEQAGEHAADRLAQQRRAGGVVAGEQVVALFVGQADVQVHAGAGQVVERLGHETGEHSVLVRDALDQALVADRLVHGGEGVAVVEGDFHLARGIFRDRRACRQAPPCRRHRGRRGTARSAPVRAGRRPGLPAGGRHPRRGPVAGGRWRRAHGRADRTPARRPSPGDSRRSSARRWCAPGGGADRRCWRAGPRSGAC